MAHSGIRRPATDERIVIVGVGFVGLPLLVAMARAGMDVVGFDSDDQRIADLRLGIDRNGDVDSGNLTELGLAFSADPAVLADRTCYVVTVPTPVTPEHQPDLRLLHAACVTIGSTMPRDSMVIIESTVDPGSIRGVCIPALEGTGLRCGADFTVAHSPERTSPGDAAHSLTGTRRVVAGFDANALRRAAAIYRRLVPAGVHEVSSIEVAELCKMVENAQRDVNIAFTNEVAMLCARLGLATREVLEACATKWNFHRYRPGLVGGHCIPVDPHYLRDRAERIGTTVRVVSAGRAVNEAMPSFVADQIISALPAGANGKAPERVGVLGLCYKPNVADLRNSGGLELARLLAAAGLGVFIHDPLVSAGDGIQPDVKLVDIQDLVELDVLILAVRHRQFDELVPRMQQMLRDDGLLVDLTGTLEPPVKTRFWSL